MWWCCHEEAKRQKPCWHKKVLNFFQSTQREVLWTQNKVGENNPPQTWFCPSFLAACILFESLKSAGVRSAIPSSCSVIMSPLLSALRLFKERKCRAAVNVSWCTGGGPHSRPVLTFSKPVTKTWARELTLHVLTQVHHFVSAVIKWLR